MCKGCDSGREKVHKTKLHRSIERDSEDLIRIGFDGRLFLIGRTAVKATGVAASDSATERLLDLSTGKVDVLLLVLLNFW